MLAKRKGGRREAASEGSVEQNHDPTNKNRIRGEGADERATGSRSPHPSSAKPSL